MSSIPFTFVSSSEECSLTRKSFKPLLFRHENGKCISTIVLKLTKPVKKITNLRFQNAGSAFITMELISADDEKESYVIYPETQQFSLEQFKSKNITAMNKTMLKPFKPNNKYIDTNRRYNTLEISMHSFIDIEESHDVGIKWIELFGVLSIV